jgi:hypothetical protein
MEAETHTSPSTEEIKEPVFIKAVGLNQDAINQLKQNIDEYTKENNAQISILDPKYVKTFQSEAEKRRKRKEYLKKYNSLPQIVEKKKKYQAKKDVIERKKKYAAQESTKISKRRNGFVKTKMSKYIKETMPQLYSAKNLEFSLEFEKREEKRNSQRKEREIAKDEEAALKTIKLIKETRPNQYHSKENEEKTIELSVDETATTEPMSTDSDETGDDHSGSGSE